jgi:micrococcal nuclease
VIAITKPDLPVVAIPKPAPIQPPPMPVTTGLRGPTRIIDGDTIIIGGTHIRLQGLDAEELSMTNGPKAKAVMADIISDREVKCRPDGTRSYNRVVASCFLPDGTDISRELVRRGWALDCAHYSGGRYRADEPRGVREKLFQARYC